MLCLCHVKENKVYGCMRNIMCTLHTLDNCVTESGKKINDIGLKK